MLTMDMVFPQPKVEKGSLCSQCKHISVCKFKDQFLDSVRGFQANEMPDFVEIEIRCIYKDTGCTARRGFDNEF